MHSSLIRSMLRRIEILPLLLIQLYTKKETWLYRPKVSVADSSNKLATHWFGPYTVDKVASRGKVYYLKDYLGDPLKYPVSINLLKLYHHREGEELQYIPFPDSLLSEPIYNPVDEGVFDEEHDDDSDEHEYVPPKHKDLKAQKGVTDDTIAKNMARLRPCDQLKRPDKYVTIILK